VSLRAAERSGLPPARGAGTDLVGAWHRFRWQHPEWGVGPVVLAGWVGVLTVEAAGPAAAPPVAVGLAHWMTMAAATMLPTALPLIRDVALSSLWRRRARTTALVTTGFLAVWWVAGVAVVGVVDLLPGALDRRVVLGATLSGAAVWELTATKRRLLRSCHRYRPLPQTGVRADVACLVTGLRSGAACCQACGPLMLPMAAAGHPELHLIVILAGLAVSRRLLRDSRAVRGASAVALAGLALVALLAGHGHAH
jgi:predicted metal-binding membrane protein